MFSEAELCEGASPMVQHTAVQLHKGNRIPEPPGNIKIIGEFWVIRPTLYEHIQEKQAIY